MDEYREALEEDIDYWEAKARSEKIAAFLSKAAVSGSVMLTALGATYALIGERPANGLVLLAAGVGGWAGFEQLAIALDHRAFDSKAQAFITQITLEDLD